MLFRSHIPAQPIASFVEYLWSLSDAPAHAKERIVPSGTLEIVINLDEDELRIYDAADPSQCRRFSGAIVSGAYGTSFVIDTREHASVIGVHFRPGGATPFLGHPAGALADSHVDLEVLWGARARELRERLCAARDLEHRFRVLEEALRASLRTPAARHGTVQRSLEHLGGESVRIGEVASQLGLSRRRFIEIFTAEVGMTPKLFARVQRFRRALSVAQRGRSPGFSQLALESGYFDQSHMIRDFIELSGASPAQLVRLSGARVKDHHVALVGS
jgi:AraC-like DNA-binding protein